jgi:methyl-accepting chemotaxis protein
MPSSEQISEMVIQHTKDIAAIQESAKSAHKRLDENGLIINGIHKLAANMENLTHEVKRVAEKLEDGLREQGKRIGVVETAVNTILNMETYVKTANDRLDKIEKEPADKWKKLTAQVVSLLVAAVVGGVIAYLAG